MKGVELDRVAGGTIFEDSRSADEGDVVVVDHVESLAEDLSELACLEQGHPGLVCCEGREESEGAFESVNGDGPVIRDRPPRCAAP